MRSLYRVGLWLSLGCVVALMVVSASGESSQAVRRAQEQLEREYQEAIKYEPESMLDLAQEYDVPSASADGKPQKWSKTKDFFNKMLDKIVITAQDVEKIAKGLGGAATRALTAPYKEIIKKEQHAIHANPYKNTVAKVRKGGPVCEGEAEYLKARRLVTRKGLEKFLDIKFPDDVPTPDVMIALSGGGTRAMISAWSFMRAIEKIGLLECANYVATLSGSSWFLWPWLLSGLSLEEYKTRLVSAAERSPVALRNPVSDTGNILKLMLRMAVYDRPATIITFYGAALAAGLLYDLGEKKDPLQSYMDMTRGALEGARVPYPVGTFISTPDARWFTETVHEVHCPGLEYGVPQWSFGWHFEKGSTGKTPNPYRRDLPSHLAASSAAIAISGKDIYYNIFQFMESGWQKDFLRGLLQESSAGQLRFTSATEFNPLFGIEGLPIYDTLNKKKWGDLPFVHFTDAGVIWSFPVIPLLGRAQQDVPVIYLIEEAGATVGPDELKKTWEYAQGSSPDGKKYKFPAVTHEEQFSKKALSFLADDDALVCYFPRVIDKDLCAEVAGDPELAKSVELLNYDMEQRVAKGIYTTFSLKYSKQATEELIAVAQVNVLGNVDRIKEVLRQYVQLYIQRVQGQTTQQYQDDRTAFYKNITPIAAKMAPQQEVKEASVARKPKANAKMQAAG